MKIRVNDYIGCIWTIAKVDVGRTVFVCRRADPEHTIVTFQQGVKFREWMVQVFAPETIKTIVLRLVLNERTDSGLLNLYRDFAQCLGEYHAARSLCQNHAARCLENAKAISAEIDKLEEHIRHCNESDNKQMTALRTEWQDLRRNNNEV